MKKILSTLFLTVGMIASGMQMAVASSDDGDSSRECSRRRHDRPCCRPCERPRTRPCEKPCVDSCGDFLSLARIAQIVNALADTQIQVNFAVVIGSLTTGGPYATFTPADPNPKDTLTLVYKKKGCSGSGTSLPLTTAVNLVTGSNPGKPPTYPIWIGTATLPGGCHSSYTAEVYGPAPLAPAVGPAPLLLKTCFKVKPSANPNGPTIVLGGDGLTTILPIDII